MQHKATLTKRVLSLVMALAMLLTLAPLSVFAAETTRTVYFQNNWLWTDVCAYITGKIGRSFPIRSAPCHT